ncbi:hypothetical protein J3A69_000124 [Pseudomonas putida]|nr:hypothetical protein [Pseudomonas sp. PvP089]MBP2088905.1 hypothetical protein [Pseudomonas sp. PvP088]MBP2220517.1 hypothetical protein [Pseudomonas putida]GLO20812.1 hypothetical protein PPUJ20188_42090 [Pseudomonas putida]
MRQRTGAARWLWGECRGIEGGQTSACLELFIACEIERRPRGASRGKPAPTSVSGQYYLNLFRAAPCLFHSISKGKQLLFINLMSYIQGARA